MPALGLVAKVLNLLLNLGDVVNKVLLIVLLAVVAATNLTVVAITGFNFVSIVYIY
jgi:hypothetical protein